MICVVLVVMGLPTSCRHHLTLCWRNRFDVAGSVLDEYCRVEKVAFAWAWPVFLGATPLLFAMKMLSLFRGNKSSNSRDDIVPDDIEPKNL